MNQPTHSKILLVQQAINGQKTAFDQLTSQYYNYCLFSAQKYIKNPETAKDLVQESLLQAYLNISKLQNPNSFQAWLAGIVRHQCLNHLRRQKQPHLPIEALIEADILTDVSDEAHEQPLTITTNEALQQLTDKHRLLLKRFYYDDYSIKEIAEQDNSSVNTTKVRLHRARKALESVMLESIIITPTIPIATVSIETAKTNYMAAA